MRETFQIEKNEEPVDWLVFGTWIATGVLTAAFIVATAFLAIGLGRHIWG